MTAAAASSAVSSDLVAAIETAIAERGWTGRLIGVEAAFRCPEHDDQKPSAHWNTRKHTWFCQVCDIGGGALDLARRLGVTTPNNPTLRPVVRPQVVASYAYVVGGQARYYIDRVEPARDGGRKDFLPRAPHVQAGDWKAYGLKKHQIDFILYQLDELPALGSGATVYIAEGERKVDLLHRWGFAATCNTGGAKKWRKPYSERLAGLHVVLVPDNDVAGVEHADRLAADLQGIAASVRVLTLPDLDTKGDVIDWAAAGGTAEAFAELAAVAPIWIASGDPSPGGCEATIARLEDRIAELERENQRLLGELEQSKTLQRGLFALQANKHTAKQAPVIAGALRHVISRRKAPADWVPVQVGTWTHVDQTTGEIIERPSEIAGGRDPETVSNYIKSFADTRPDLLEYRTVPGRTGRPILECRTAAPSLSVALAEAAKTDRKLERAVETNPPAKYDPNRERRCKSCGGASFREHHRLIDRVALVCADCQTEAPPEERVVSAWTVDPHPKISVIEVRDGQDSTGAVDASPPSENFGQGEDRALALARITLLRQTKPAERTIRTLDEKPVPGLCTAPGCTRPAEFDNGADGYACGAHALFRQGGRARPLKATYQDSAMRSGHAEARASAGALAFNRPSPANGSSAPASERVKAGERSVP